MSSLLNKGSRNSLTSAWSFTVSLGHKKAAHTALSGVLSILSTYNNLKSKKELKHKKTLNFAFGPTHASSKISQTIFFLFYNQLAPRTKKLAFQNFCSTAVGLLCSESNFVSKSKEIRNLQ